MILHTRYGISYVIFFSLQFYRPEKQTGRQAKQQCCLSQQQNDFFTQLCLQIVKNFAAWLSSTSLLVFKRQSKLGVQVVHPQFFLGERVKIYLDFCHISLPISAMHPLILAPSLDPGTNATVARSSSMKVKVDSVQSSFSYKLLLLKTKGSK